MRTWGMPEIKGTKILEKLALGVLKRPGFERAGGVSIIFFLWLGLLFAWIVFDLGRKGAMQSTYSNIDHLKRFDMSNIQLLIVPATKGQARTDDYASLEMRLKAMTVKPVSQYKEALPSVNITGAYGVTKKRVATG